MKKIFAAVLVLGMIFSFPLVSIAQIPENAQSVTTKEILANSDNTVAFSNHEFIFGSEFSPDTTLYLFPVGSARENFQAATALDGSEIPLTDLENSNIFNVLSSPECSQRFKISIKKEAGSKVIKSIKATEKTGDFIFNTTGDHARLSYLEVKLNDDDSDEETQVEFTVTYTAKEDITFDTARDHFYLVKGGKIKVTHTLWVKNGVLSLDNTVKAGTGGVYVKPNKNDRNELVWEDENSDLAKLTFSASDDPSGFYPKMTTKWLDDQLAQKFSGVEAVVRSFKTSRTIDGASRPTLTFYFPDEFPEDLDISKVTIYKLAEDGSLENVTERFTYIDTDADGNILDAWQGKTHTLGTYIIAETEVPV